METMADMDDEEGVTGACCYQCENARRSSVFMSMKERANNTDLFKSKTPNKYLNMQQMQQKADVARIRRNESAMATMNQDRKLASLCHMRSEHERLLEALGTKKVVRLHALLASALKQGKSPDAIVTLINAASDGEYNPKQYDEEDLDLTILTLRIGGPVLVHALAKAGHVASRSFVYNNGLGKLPRFTITPCPLKATLIKNFETFLFPNYDSTDKKRCGWTVAIDDVALEENSDLRGEGPVLGSCFEHSGGINFNVNSFEEMQHLWSKFEKGVVHYAKDARVIALIGNRKDHNSAVPVLVYVLPII
jgi:hypothetical protein